MAIRAMEAAMAHYTHDKEARERKLTLRGHVQLPNLWCTSRSVCEPHFVWEGKGAGATFLTAGNGNIRMIRSSKK